VGRPTFVTAQARHLTFDYPVIKGDREGRGYQKVGRPTFSEVCHHRKTGVPLPLKQGISPVLLPTCVPTQVGHAPYFPKVDTCQLFWQEYLPYETIRKP
jgi:hypothetical protein